MRDQRKSVDKNPSAVGEESAITATRKAKRYIIKKELLALLQKKREEQPRRARRFAINTELLEVNGKSRRGAKIVDLSMNGAKLALPFSPPFMSHMTLTFSLGGAEKVFKVVGRVIWSRMSLEKGWFEVGMQFYQNYWEIEYVLRLELG
jgi:hypothetical protein